MVRVCTGDQKSVKCFSKQALTFTASLIDPENPKISVKTIFVKKMGRKFEFIFRYVMLRNIKKQLLFLILNLFGKGFYSKFFINMIKVVAKRVFFYPEFDPMYGNSAV